MDRFNGNDRRAKPPEPRAQRDCGQRQPGFPVPPTGRIGGDHHAHVGRPGHRSQHGAHGPHRVQQTPAQV